MRRSQKKGFTAVELIVIVTIVGLIFIVLLPYYLESLQKAKQRATVAGLAFAPCSGGRFQTSGTSSTACPTPSNTSTAS